MNQHDPQLREDGFHALRPFAYKYIKQLIDEFLAEKDHGLYCWLLELIRDAQAPEMLPLLTEYLLDDDKALRYWAARGLQKLAPKEAQRILRESGYKDLF